MSVHFNFSAGSAGSAGDRSLYDTKERATLGDRERIFTQNVPDYVEQREGNLTYKELRSNLVEYARQMDEDELEREHEGSGKTRSYYRGRYSFHRDTSDEKAKAMVSEHQQENFPDNPILNALHRNAKHLHVHSVIFARKTDGKKLQLGYKTYRSLDESWARIYGREFGAELEKEHLQKKEERRAHRAVALEAKRQGKAPPPRPPRISHERNQVEERKNIALREHGVSNGIKQAGTRGIERPVTGADRGASGAVERQGGTASAGRERSVAGRVDDAETATRRDAVEPPQRDRDPGLLSAEPGERPVRGRKRAGASQTAERGGAQEVGRGSAETGTGARDGSGRAQADEVANRRGPEPGERSLELGGGLEASGNRHWGGAEDGAKPQFNTEIREAGLGERVDSQGDTARAGGERTEGPSLVSNTRDAGGELGLPGSTTGGGIVPLPGSHGTELDMALDVVLKPLHEQHERERAAEALERAETQSLVQSQPAGKETEVTERQDPEPVQEIEHDIFFDR